MRSHYDWEIEQAVLGGLLLGGTGGARDLHGLLPEEFHKPVHQHLFERILELDSRQENHDLPLILSLIRGDPRGPDWFGGIAYVATLPGACPSLEALPGYARRIRTLANLRKIQALAHEITESGGDEDELRARGAALAHLVSTAAAHKKLSWNRGLPFREPPSPDWLLVEPGERQAAGVFPTGKVGLLAAPGGVGKSSALAWLAIAIATGRPWFGLTVPRPGKVALILGEETAVDIARKLHFGARALRLTPEEQADAHKNILTLGTAGQSVALLRTDRDGNLHPSAFADQLFAELSQEGPWRALLLDPLSRFSHAETETDAAAATRTVEALERLATLPGNPSLLVAHHSRKLGRGESGMTGDDIRGSSALRDGVRWAAVLDILDIREGIPGIHGAVRLSVVKSNVGRIPAPAIALREGWGALRDATPPELRLLEKTTAPATKPARRVDVKNDD